MRSNLWSNRAQASAIAVVLLIIQTDLGTEARSPPTTKNLTGSLSRVSGFLWPWFTPIIHKLYTQATKVSSKYAFMELLILVWCYFVKVRQFWWPSMIRYDALGYTIEWHNSIWYDMIYVKIKIWSDMTSFYLHSTVWFAVRGHGVCSLANNRETLLELRGDLRSDALLATTIDLFLWSDPTIHCAHAVYSSH